MQNIFSAILIVAGSVIVLLLPFGPNYFANTELGEARKLSKNNLCNDNGIYLIICYQNGDYKITEKNLSRTSKLLVYFFEFVLIFGMFHIGSLLISLLLLKKPFLDNLLLNTGAIIILINILVSIIMLIRLSHKIGGFKILLLLIGNDPQVS